MSYLEEQEKEIVVLNKLIVEKNARIVKLEAVADAAEHFAALNIHIETEYFVCDFLKQSGECNCKAKSLKRALEATK